MAEHHSEHVVDATSPWTCVNCGNTGLVPRGVAVTCSCGYVDVPKQDLQPEREQLPPNILEKGRNYARAWWKWKKAGSPTREAKEVLQLREVCKACHMFDGETCTHRSCGCNVRSGSILGDKLLWATEHCPIGKW